MDHLGQAWLSLVQNWEMSAIQVFLLYINHSQFSWYIKQCLLLSKGPLLGVSVNGELTVLLCVCVCVCGGGGGGGEVKLPQATLPSNMQKP